ncbi:MAG: acetate--CoA ligase family protein, partial [Anaerolineae bacterium]|nr:acetate--CoA ligase family protein [Anaerolineae bacterium]
RADEAVLLANKTGYPVALKLVADGVIHKADAGGLALNLTTPDQVRQAFGKITADRDGARAMVQAMVPAGHETIIGAKRDPQFGPVVMFGTGGTYVEVRNDISFRLVPVSAQEAAEMIDETAMGSILKGIRGQPPADLQGIIDVIVRIGQLVTDFPIITELDINPLIVGPAEAGCWAVDARIAVDR